MSSVWVSTSAGFLESDSATEVVRLNPRTLNVQTTVSLNDSLSNIAFANAYIWATEPASGKLWRIDPASDQIVDATDIGARASAINRPTRRPLGRRHRLTPTYPRRP